MPRYPSALITLLHSRRGPPGAKRRKKGAAARKSKEAISGAKVQAQAYQVYQAAQAAPPKQKKGRLPEAPTAHFPGTLGKEAVMSERARLKQTLFHPNDAGMPLAVAETPADFELRLPG